MDTSDPEIKFDENGVCNHCHQFEEISSSRWLPNEEGARRWRAALLKIKTEGQDRKHDCILGLSGGVDSSFLALKVQEWGLRPLVMHVDAGWNTEAAAANITSIVNYCQYDLHTKFVNRDDMRDLHLAYLRAGISNQDVPQDHIFFASLYHYATKNNIKYVLSGGNLATEGIFPSSWHGSAMDAINLKAIHKLYGDRKLENYDTISFFEYYVWYPFFKKMRVYRPLNYMPYNKDDALAELVEKVDYHPYGRKHGESLFTKLFQNYYLPTKFGMDKRRPHLSSLIVSGQMTREAAMEALEEPLYGAQELELDIELFCEKLRISRKEFDEFMQAPKHHYSDFSNWDGRYRALRSLKRLVVKILGRELRVHY